MTGHDARIDAYIENAPEYARPILTELREAVHAACPETQEAVKWGMPTFMHNGILASMAAFKNHCAFRFWKESVLRAGDDDAFPELAKITAVSELPPHREFAALVHRAAELNRKGVKLPRSTPSTPRPEAEVPDDLLEALRRNPHALREFEAFSPSNRREYVEWITDAKRAETRRRRLAQAIDWIAEGKPRNWKYM